MSNLDDDILAAFSRIKCETCEGVAGCRRRVVSSAQTNELNAVPNTHTKIEHPHLRRFESRLAHPHLQSFSLQSASGPSHPKVMLSYGYWIGCFAGASLVSGRSLW
jgi:hypothetical protein